MKKFLLSLSTAVAVLSPLAASAAPIKVLDYEAKTQLSYSWERPENRALLLARMKNNHSNKLTGEFFESSFEANKVEIGKYSKAVRCLKGETEACKPVSKL